MNGVMIVNYDKNEDFHLDQVGIRLVKERTYYSDEPIDSPDKAVKLLANELKDYDREVVAVINMSEQCIPLNINIVSVGSINRSIITPREMLKTSILCNAAKVIMVHNHPSGDITPSRPDIQITDRMNRIYSLMGITLEDHIIIGSDDKYYSFHNHIYEYDFQEDFEFACNLDDYQRNRSYVAESILTV
jgi:DNA repair protein RadC